MCTSSCSEMNNLNIPIGFQQRMVFEGGIRWGSPNRLPSACENTNFGQIVFGRGYRLLPGGRPSTTPRSKPAVAPLNAATGTLDKSSLPSSSLILTFMSPEISHLDLGGCVVPDTLIPQTVTSQFSCFSLKNLGKCHS